MFITSLFTSIIIISIVGTFTVKLLKKEHTTLKPVSYTHLFLNTLSLACLSDVKSNTGNLVLGVCSLLTV